MLDHDAVEKQRIVIDPAVYARIDLGRCYIALTTTTVLIDIETKVVGWNLATGAPVVTT